MIQHILKAPLFFLFILQIHFTFVKMWEIINKHRWSYTLGDFSGLVIKMRFCRFDHKCTKDTHYHSHLAIKCVSFVHFQPFSTTSLMRDGLWADIGFLWSLIVLQKLAQFSQITKNKNLIKAKSYKNNWKRVINRLSHALTNEIINIWFMLIYATSGICLGLRTTGLAKGIYVEDSSCLCCRGVLWVVMSSVMYKAVLCNRLLILCGTGFYSINLLFIELRKQICLLKWRQKCNARK